MLVHSKLLRAAFVVALVVIIAGYMDVRALRLIPLPK